MMPQVFSSDEDFNVWFNFNDEEHKDSSKD
jgi:hypothetical protein